MTVSLPHYKLTYFPVPKVACTSIKQMFYHIREGKPFVRQKVDGKMVTVHDLYPTRSFANVAQNDIADHVRLTVVRDPRQRFLSCYSNRVLFHGELNAPHISPEMQKAGALPRPTLAQFIDRLDIYREASASIRHHCDPLTMFLGRDPSYFTRIFSIKQMDLFTKRVQKITDSTIVPGHSQTGGKKLFVRDLTQAQRQKLRKFYEEDYDIYGGFLK